MDCRKRKRKRGVTLTPQGLQKLELARSQAEALQNQDARFTLENLSELTKLSPDTVMRVFAGEERVDKQTLRCCFRAFNLVLQADDYSRPQSTDSEPEYLPQIINEENRSIELILELPKGQVPLDSDFYIERQPWESRCYEVVQEPGALIRIKAPKQMGKTSLMTKVLAKARERQYSTVTLSLLLAEEEVFTSLARFLKWFCACLSQSLSVPNRLEELWDDIYGSSYNVISYFEQHLLPSIDNSLVLALDDIDCIFQHPKIAADFFGLLRAIHEKAKYGDGCSEIWRKLRIIVVHSTEVYIPLNTNQSPFNVGLSIELPEFTRCQILELATRHRLSWTNEIAEQLMDYVGGHPLLVRQALYHIARNEASLEEFLGISDIVETVYGDYLRRLLVHLQQHNNLMSTFSQVVKSVLPVSINPIDGFILQSLGLVKLQETNAVPACQLYLQYFRDRI
jgi:AAA-like domain